MAAPPNLDLQAPGAAGGRAAGWVVSSLVTSRLRAGWRAVEDRGATDGGHALAGPNDFDVTGGWQPTNVNVTADAGAAPDGSTTADKLVADFVNGLHHIALFTQRDFTEGRTYTFGFWHKAVDFGLAPSLGAKMIFGADYVAAVPIVGTADVYSVTTPPVGPIDRVSAEGLELASGGWAAVSITIRMSADATGTPAIAFMFSEDSGSFTGNLQGHLAWGAFLYEGDLLEAETFENAWQLDPYLDTLVIGETGTRALFDDGTTNPSNEEGFEGGWGVYLDTVVGTAALWNGALEADGFEAVDGWDATYALTISGGVAALWPVDPEEPFEGWDPAYATTISGGVAATWDGPLLRNEEAFEFVIPDVAVSADTGADSFLATAHGLANDTALFVRSDGGDVPAPLVKTVVYYVVNATADAFQLSLTLGGAAINLTTPGLGDLSVRGDPRRYWYGPDLNPTI